MHKQTKFFCIGLHKNKYLSIEYKFIRLQFNFKLVDII